MKLLSIFTTIMRILMIFFILLVREIHHCVNISCIKIKDAIIIHVKFRVKDLKTLRCFRILVVYIAAVWDNFIKSQGKNSPAFPYTPFLNSFYSQKKTS